jgi:hypothetical protein
VISSPEEQLAMRILFQSYLSRTLILLIELISNWPQEHILGLECAFFRPFDLDGWFGWFILFYVFICSDILYTPFGDLIHLASLTRYCCHSFSLRPR